MFRKLIEQQIEIENIPMLDGGIVDSLPLQRAIADGYTRNVVVLTRNRGYRKDSKDIRVPSFVYRKYPKLREALSRRCAVYNEQLEMVENLQFPHQAWEYYLHK